jgi:MFS family permease
LRSRRGLDWFVFFVADVQTGFGPFVAVYLTAQKWTQTDIGLILTVGGLIALFGQIPGGAILDAMRSPRLAAAISIVLIGISALILALWPVFPAVLASRVLQAGASCILGPAIAALSLGLVRRSEIGERLGRNGSFASIGTGLAAAGMGACGYYISNQAVFFVTAAFVAPAMIALLQIDRRDIDPDRAHGSTKAQPLTLAAAKNLLTNRTLAIFALCVMLFHLANAAMLPLVASMLTLQSSESSAALIAVAMVVPQFIVAILSPTVGRKAQQWGRRPVLLIGFSALVIRGVLFAAVTPSEYIVAVQILDGISAATLGVLVPLSIADITRNSGRFNLTQGLVGCAMGIGASISTSWPDLFRPSTS